MTCSSSSRYARKRWRPSGREPAERLRPPVLESLPDFDESRLFQHVEMPAQVAVGQRAEPLEIREQQPLGPHDERRHDPEPRLLVQHALEAVVGEASGLRELAGLFLLHDRCSISDSSPFEIPVQHRRQELADAERAADRPRVQRFGPARGPQQRGARRVEVQRDPAARADQVRPRRKDAEAERRSPRARAEAAPAPGSGARSRR